LFDAGKFDELEAMAEGFRASKSRFTDGVWKLAIFGLVFELDPRNPEEAFLNQIAMAERWRKAMPKSVTAQTVLADAWGNYAWKARGDGYAHEVNEAAWPITRARIDNAWKIINEPLAPGTPDLPMRHEKRLILAKAKGVGRESYESLFREAVQLEPGYYTLYGQKTTYLQPKWYGEPGELEQFVDGVRTANPGGEGPTIYARTVWSMFLAGEVDGFDNEHITWDKMKEGYQQIRGKYPKSAWILNNFAKFSCRAADYDTLYPLMKSIDSGNFYGEAWQDVDFNGCREKVGLPPLSEGR
jgi:hypothetical protein